MSVYNFILGHAFAVTLDAIASSVHLKLNYHNVHNKLVMINTDLFGAKRIYKDLQ